MEEILTRKPQQFMQTLIYTSKMLSQHQVVYTQKDLHLSALLKDKERISKSVREVTCHAREFVKSDFKSKTMEARRQDIIHSQG